MTSPSLPKGEVRVYSVPPSRCETPHGPGTVVCYEVANTWERLGVVLDVNPFNFSPAYYLFKEISGYPTGGAA